MPRWIFAASGRPLALRGHRGTPLALSLGVVAGVFQFVRYPGALAAALPAILIGCTVGPSMAPKVAPLFLRVHLIEGYGTKPRIPQRADAIPPAALLTMRVVMGTLFGLMVILLASPLTLVLTSSSCRPYICSTFLVTG